MTKFSDSSDIITSEMEDEDLKKAIHYTTISLPWTFDRMQYGPRTQNSVNERVMNILKGVLNQSILKRELESMGYNCATDWSDYRESDVFDFEIDEKLYDVKTTHIYDEYGESGDWEREPISPELIEEYKDNQGPEWKTFLPMIVPFTQLRGSSSKDEFIFGIAETYEDIRNTNPEVGDQGYWVAAPFSSATHFFQTPTAITAREEQGNGFTIDINWGGEQTTLTTDHREIEITLIGEWDEERQVETVTLDKYETVTTEKEFSGFSMARFEHPAALTEEDEITFTPESSYEGKIPKPTNPRTDLSDDDVSWEVRADSFVNLQVPADYKVMWVGHIPQEEYFQEFQKYPAYFNPKGDMTENEPARLTESLKEDFERLDRSRQETLDEGEPVARPEMMSLVDTDAEEIDAGILVAAFYPSGPLGAACYYYPPYTFREKALYVLPKDLYSMDSITKNSN